MMTGAGGDIGSRLRPLLRHCCDFRAVDIVPVEDEADTCIADITRLDQVIPLMAGVQAVVHMAIAPARDYPDEDDLARARLDVNVKGTYSVFEAARRVGVPRVVYASSVMVNWGYPPERYVSLRDPVRPGVLYGATKYFGEVLGEMYHREHGLAVICWRIGQPADHSDPQVKRRQSERDRGVLVSFPDIAQGFARALQSDVGFGVYHLVSDNSDGYCETAAATHDLGYEPCHRFTMDGVETLREWPAAEETHGGQNSGQRPPMSDPDTCLTFEGGRLVLQTPKTALAAGELLVNGQHASDEGVRNADGQPDAVARQPSRRPPRRRRRPPAAPARPHSSAAARRGWSPLHMPGRPAPWARGKTTTYAPAPGR